MSSQAVAKYVAPTPIDNPDRQWPEKELSRAPMWCSVDLRDGNQALPNPLTPAAKIEYFQMLCAIGFKTIEVAFPSASQDDFDFTRRLVDDGHIPDDVYIMGLTQCREPLIDRTFESLAGVGRGIVHAYIATSDLHMKQVFGKGREETLKTAVAATEQIRARAEAMGDADIRYEFSPEEFTDSDLEYVLEVCEAVFEAWGRATPERPMVMNLPATVERRPPNDYADMIEVFCRRFSRRDSILVSLHSHNDQGMAVASTELSLRAGADRVEGTLFGHGERTGNVDIVTVANNLRVRGIETGLDFHNLDEIGAAVQRLTGMEVYYRQPYSGEYVFTAFSGSHQDAINKGMHRREAAGETFGIGWKVPYLHIDPADIGRQYLDLIRINSQSGKGGVAWVLEQDHGLDLPRAMHPEIGRAVQAYSDQTHRELNSREVMDVFEATFLNPNGPLSLMGYWPRPDDENPTMIHGEVRMEINGEEQILAADGNGPIDAFVHAMHEISDEAFRIQDYHEDTLGKGSDAKAMAYISLAFEDGTSLFGAGTDTNIDQAAVKAIVAALNRRTA
ncbi:MAG: 2-isopropylmalate synthase [Planctomycetes bacterium]|jgi:2-isopropylmalate synthase|nr:2-isopropylmalate synthase [Phycisphaerae bacterium]NBB94503.1 2-isopropylmalate synthase [Planctomycetota bacterium]